MKKPLILLSLLLAACTGLRDLYDTTDAVLHVKGSWARSLGRPRMQEATVLLHHSGGNDVKAYFSRPNEVSPHVSKGDYDVLVFNGIMESESATNLDHVYFRGTGNLSTFEACVAEAQPNARLSRNPGEYIASNGMELFTFAHHRVTIDEDSALYIKYLDGVRTEDAASVPIVADSIESVPRAVSFYFQVRMTNIVNPASTRSAAGALRGFLGSVFMPASGERPRPGFPATHHLTFSQPAGSSTRTDGAGIERGTLISQMFVSFGPPLPRNWDVDKLPASGQYFFEPVFVLNDGSKHAVGTFDVTNQVNTTIARILEHHGDGEDISRDENIFEIVLDDEITLPVVSGGDGGPNITVDPWDDDEIVIVWVRS